MELFLRLTGCVIYTITIITTICLLVKTIKEIKNGSSFWCVCGYILGCIGQAYLGVALGILFQQVSHLI